MFFTPCNRTYHGLTGRSYFVTVPSQPSARAPPAAAATPPAPSPPCLLTFTAAGGQYGDIVQLTFEKFSVGKYTSSSSMRGRSQVVECEGSYINIEERVRGGTPRSARGGRWCGQGEGTNIFYSETNTVSVKIVTARKDDTPTIHIRYRFLPRSTAVVRFGFKTKPKFRGEAVSNTECSKILRGCRTKPCILQSPNFPGFYLRNLTCYYLVKALPAPSPLFKPVISLSQPNNRLIHVGDNAIVSRISPEVSIQRQCPGDHISIYDGGEMKAPLLVQFCGSTSLPNITSSGPEMLVVFHSATAGRMNHPPKMVVGFELIARELFRKQDFGSDCLVHITSFENKHGIIRSPTYAMPSNSSCLYSFTGKQGEILWLYFSKYYRQRKFDASFNDYECKNGLTIEEFKSKDETFKDHGKSIGRFCDDINPPVCIRSKHKNRLSLPCSETESFLSSTPNVSITQRFTDGTSLSPLEYVLHYEYVTTDKVNDKNDPYACEEKYSSSLSRKGVISSPKSVFMFGREYEYDKATACQHDRNVTGNWGVLPLGNSSSSSLCDLIPWRISGSINQYIHLSVPGSHPSSSSCNTNNRIIIFYEGTPVKSICPSSSSEENKISVFSSGWHERGPWHERQQILFRYIGREPGFYNLMWLEITRDPQPPALESVAIGGGHRITGSGSCPSECPEILACINSSLWCDGVTQCPSGADESSCNKSGLAWMQTLVLFGSGTALTVVAVTVLGITATHVVRQEKLKKRKKKQAQQLMTQEVLLPLSSKADSYYSS
ncbi:CUB domain [Trinorchestia longiramus]|nr:CUB domain [Trinorchestia longiramus]